MGLPVKKLRIMVTPLHGHMSDLQGILKWTDGQWHHLGGKAIGVDTVGLNCLLINHIHIAFQLNMLNFELLHGPVHDGSDRYFIACPPESIPFYPHLTKYTLEAIWVEL